MRRSLWTSLISLALGSILISGGFAPIPMPRERSDPADDPADTPAIEFPAQITSEKSGGPLPRAAPSAPPQDGSIGRNAEPGEGAESSPPDRSLARASEDEIRRVLHEAIKVARRTRPLRVPPAIIDTVVREARVRVVFELDAIHRPSLVDSLPITAADLAHVSEFDGDRTAIAILDTSIEGTHPFFENRLVEEACFSVLGGGPNASSHLFGPGSVAPCAQSQCNHGTHVAGIATAVASDNESLTNAINVPACLSNVIRVGSTTDTDTVSSFMNASSFLSVRAFSQSVESAALGGGARYASDTSTGTPHVSGAIATIREAHPTATVAEIENAIALSGTPVLDDRNGETIPPSRGSGCDRPPGGLASPTPQPPTLSIPRSAVVARRRSPRAPQAAAKAVAWSGASPSWH